MSFWTRFWGGKTPVVRSGQGRGLRYRWQANLPVRRFVPRHRWSFPDAIPESGVGSRGRHPGCSHNRRGLDRIRRKGCRRPPVCGVRSHRPLLPSWGIPKQEGSLLKAIDGTLGRFIIQAGKIVGNPIVVVVSLLGPKDSHMGNGSLRRGRKESSFAKASSWV